MVCSEEGIGGCAQKRSFESPQSATLLRGGGRRGVLASLELFVQFRKRRRRQHRARPGLREVEPQWCAPASNSKQSLSSSRTDGAHWGCLLSGGTRGEKGFASFIWKGLALPIGTWKLSCYC